MRKTKNKDGALEKNVDYQFEFPRQCNVHKNALSLTQAPMVRPEFNSSIMTFLCLKFIFLNYLFLGGIDRHALAKEVSKFSFKVPCDIVIEFKLYYLS